MPIRHSSINIKRQNMKKIEMIILLTAFFLQAFCQVVPAETKSTNKQVSVADTNEIVKVVIGQEAVTVEGKSDEITVKVGNKRLRILDSLEGKVPKFELENLEKDNSIHQDEGETREQKRERERTQFRGHWSGIDLGFNNYLTSDHSFTLPSDIDYMSLHSGKSMNFNLNFAQVSLGFAKHFGIVTGLGINWNNYRFDGNNNIQKGTDGVIEIRNPGEVLKKSKLTTVYFDLPILFELQIPADHSHLNIAAGPIGGVKLSSHSKMVYEDGNKIKSDGDFSLSMLRYGGTARLGYGNFQIYGTYYLTPLFKAGKSPAGVELYPFEIGVAFAFND
jgi:hypothetical protein